MAFLQYNFRCAPEMVEPLLGILSGLEFDSFQEEEDGLLAYLDASNRTDALDEAVREIHLNIPYILKISEMEEVNWNAVWESNFDPVQVGSFCGIRASFHPHFSPPVEHEILIDPKMAFGTGHHETTSLVIATMQQLNLEGSSVFDYGCGTGVLAILAKMMGAGHTDAVDIEEPAYQNTLENVENNNVGEIRVFEGTIDAVPPRKYDLILANINRNVILNSLERLAQKLLPEGRLIISGFLDADLALMEQKLKETGFKTLESKQKNHWMCMLVQI